MKFNAKLPGRSCGAAVTCLQRGSNTDGVRAGVGLSVEADGVFPSAPLNV